ncbi:MAG TPA: succinate dehydrogenase assembly factor 2 [Gallionella sp.]|nr:succinate dehydrogenase assembly factor 2 [Gallionella sp.]
MKNLERIRWRSRRGLLELDIVLARFIDKHYVQLDDAGQRAFEELLDTPDNLLWDMIVGRAGLGVQQAAPESHQALLELIRSS